MNINGGYGMISVLSLAKVQVELSGVKIVVLNTRFSVGLRPDHMLP
jgi:hypothetical protein